YGGLQDSAAVPFIPGEQAVLRGLLASLNSPEVAERLSVDVSDAQADLKRAVHRPDGRAKVDALAVAIGEGMIAPPVLSTLYRPTPRLPPGRPGPALRPRRPRPPARRARSRTAPP